MTVFDFPDDVTDAAVRIKAFAGPNREWLDFVVANRKEQYAGDQFDIVYGPVANDRTILTINDYISGAIPAETALILLEPNKLTDQYCFLTVRGLSLLRFKEVITNVG